VTGLPEQPEERLFVAVEVPPSVRDELALAVAPLQRLAPSLRWGDPARWHLTLAFLGSVPAESAVAVDRAVAAAVTGVPPFGLQLSGSLGTFSRAVLYVALERSEPLEDLARRVRESLRSAGFELEERAFRAHLTLGRVRRGERVPRSVVSGFTGPATAWQVERVVVVRSRLGPGGADHEVRSVAPFDADA
jgi:RNA 2',3'-cyclic 3'-phosphodiesterase